MDFILSITVFGFFTQKKNPPKLVPKNYLSLYTNFCTNSKTCINKSIQKKKNSLLIQQLISIYIACYAKYIDLTVTSKIKQIWNSILRSKVKKSKINSTHPIFPFIFSPTIKSNKTYCDLHSKERSLCEL